MTTTPASTNKALKTTRMKGRTGAFLSQGGCRNACAERVRGEALSPVGQRATADRIEWDPPVMLLPCHESVKRALSG
ncbi:hypothetical protein Hesp01_54280 [Herbidospora sp. NBRC 101105]|nr:hypothetical protein Hesp01_54280 [Herbidospora sp. NBRC 101105]